MKRSKPRDPSPREVAEAKRIAALPEHIRKGHPRSVRADPGKLAHISTYGDLPTHYIDQPFTCQDCGKEQIWRAEDQKWYYEEAKGHIDAVAVECHDCRKAKRSGTVSVDE